MKQVLHHAMRQVERDQAFYTRHLVKAGVDPTTGKVLYKYTYSPVVTRTGVHSLLKKFTREEKELDETIAKKEAERRKEIAGILLAEMDKIEMNRQFSIAEKNLPYSDMQVLIVKTAEARLYQKGKAKVFIPRDEIATGKVNPRTNTLEIYRKGRVYQTRKSYFLSLRDFTKNYYRDRLKLEDQIFALENDMKLLVIKRKNLYELIADLQYKTVLGGQYLRARKIVIIPGTHRLYKMKYPDDEPVFFIRPSLAQSVAKGWNKELKTLKATAERSAVQLLAYKKELLKLEQNYTKLAKEMEAVRNSFLQAEADRGQDADGR